jgi:predicted dehydrogenase
LSSTKERNVAVVGLGWWGSKVLRNFCEGSSFSRVFAYDKDPGRLSQARATWDVQPLNDLDELWSQPTIEAVAVVTPPETHFDLVRQAFRHGKHVMVAKPPARSVEEVEELCSLAEEKGRVFMVDSTFVYNPATLKVRELVEKELPADLKFVRSLRYGDDVRFHSLQRILDLMRISRMDVIEDLAFHDISVLEIVFGRPLEVRSVNRIHTFNAEFCDTAFIELDMQGIPVHIGYSWSLPERRRQLLLTSGEGYLLFDDLKEEKKIEIHSLGTKESRYPSYPEREPLREVVEHFFTCIEKGQEPLTGKEFMLNVMRVLRRIKQFGLEGDPSG